MLRNYFKTTEDFQAPSFEDGRLEELSEDLYIEKGDIIVDVRPFDHESLIGKTLISQKMVRIPKHCVEELKDDCEADNDASKRESRGSQSDMECSKRKSGSLHEECKRKSKDSKQLEDRSNRNSVESGSAKQESRAEEQKPPVEIRDEYVPISPQNAVVPNPKAPPRTKKKRDQNGDTFRSRESDEGYNSCSHYSGDKPPENEHTPARSSYYNTPIGADVPILTSFGESPHRVSSPRPSIQDSDGYEIPSFISGEVATNDEKGVTLKFIYQRKSTSFDEKFAETVPLNGKFHLGSIGENSEPVYETWDTVVNSMDEKKKAMKDRILVLVYFGISVLVSLSLFFVLLFVSGTAPLMSFTATVNLFAIVFVGLLTMGKRRWLCIATLLAPTLFSKKVKIGLCITLLILMIAGPVWITSSNIKMVLNCKSFVHNVSESVQHQNFAARSPGEFSSQPNNTAATLSLAQCELTLRNALQTSSLSSNCAGQDVSCVVKTFQPQFGELCRNLSKTRERKRAAGVAQTPGLRRVHGLEDTLKLALLQLLPLLLLLILYEAYWYNRDYLANKEMDNVYITGKLKALDKERNERGMKNRLFPLRKLEFRTYVLPSSFLQTSQEMREMFKWIVIWISFGLAVLLCIYLDKNIHEILLFLTENSSSNCDIHLRSLDQIMVYSICIMLALLIIAIIFQSYALRARSRICSYFYPKKESARGLFLYHKILRDRAVFWKACRERGKMLSEGRRTRWKIGIGHRLFSALPNSVRTLLEKLFIYRCMICNSLTYRRTFVCKDEDCFATFCYECFIDMGQSCISCRPNGVRDSVFTSV